MASRICLWRTWQKQQRYSNEVQTLSLGAFVTALKAANEKVRTLTATRTDERMAKAVGALKASRKASDEAYRQLVKFVNAYALIGIHRSA